LGLALSGGGARGLAHIGVLKVLEQEGVPIDLLVGTSVGGLVGALFACGLSAHEIEAEALHLCRLRQLVGLVDRSLPRRGLLRGERVTSYLGRWLGDTTFEELSLPFAVIAVDLMSQKKVVLDRGSVLAAVRASIAVPGIFAPVSNGEQMLVDGGLLDNLPIGVARDKGADVVIGVDVSSDTASITHLISSLRSNRIARSMPLDTMTTMLLAMRLVVVEINTRAKQEAGPYISIEPQIPPMCSAFNGFTHARELIGAGEAAARAALPKIQSRAYHGTSS